MPNPNAYPQLRGARIEDAAYRYTEGGDTIFEILTDRGTYRLRATAWSDVLANATDGESSDLTTHVSIEEVPQS